MNVGVGATQAQWTPGNFWGFAFTCSGSIVLNLSRTVEPQTQKQDFEFDLKQVSSYLEHISANIPYFLVLLLKYLMSAQQFIQNQQCSCSLILLWHNLTGS